MIEHPNWSLVELLSCFGFKSCKELQLLSFSSLYLLFEWKIVRNERNKSLLNLKRSSASEKHWPHARNEFLKVCHVYFFKWSLPRILLTLSPTSNLSRTRPEMAWDWLFTLFCLLILDYHTLEMRREHSFRLFYFPSCAATGLRWPKIYILLFFASSLTRVRSRFHTFAPRALCKLTSISF